MSNFDWLGLMKAITYAHVESLKVSASLPSAPGAELGTGREGTVAASPAVPSFQGLTIERLISDVERIQDEHSAD